MNQSLHVSQEHRPGCQPSGGKGDAENLTTEKTFGHKVEGEEPLAKGLSEHYKQRQDR